MYSSSPNPAGGQTGRKVARYKKNRRSLSPATPARPFYTIPTIVGVGSGPGSGTGPGNVLTVNFDMAVSVYVGPGAPTSGIHDGSSSPALTVVSITQLAPTQVEIVMSGQVQPGDIIVVPFDDPVIRTFQGGFVQPGNYTAP